MRAAETDMINGVKHAGRGESSSDLDDVLRLKWAIIPPQHDAAAHFNKSSAASIGVPDFTASLINESSVSAENVSTTWRVAGVAYPTTLRPRSANRSFRPPSCGPTMDRAERAQRESHRFLAGSTSGNR